MCWFVVSVRNWEEAERFARHIVCTDASSSPNVANSRVYGFPAKSLFYSITRSPCVPSFPWIRWEAEAKVRTLSFGNDDFKARRCCERRDMIERNRANVESDWLIGVWRLSFRRPCLQFIYVDLLRYNTKWKDSRGENVNKNPNVF